MADVNKREKRKIHQLAEIFLIQENRYKRDELPWNTRKLLIITRTLRILRLP